MFRQKKRKFSVLYKDNFWIWKVGLFTIIWWKNEIKKQLEGKWYFVQKVIETEKVLKIARKKSWSDRKLLNFTITLRLELSKGISWVVTNKDAVNEVYKKTFDPVVYWILTELNNNRALEDIIADYTNVFDDVYIETVKSFFTIKSKPEEWLLRLEKRIQERIDFKNRIIQGTRSSLLAIIMVFIASFVLDSIIYERLKTNYWDYNRTLPDFTVLYHNIIYGIVKYTGIILMLYWIITTLVENSRSESLKIYLGKIKLQIPIYWAIHKKRIIYEFTDTFLSMRESDIIQRTILWILSRSCTNYYLSAVINAAAEEVKWWESLWRSFESFAVFTWEDEDVLHALQSSSLNESLKALKNKKSSELEKKVDKTLNALKFVLFTSAVVLILLLGAAYYWPVQQQQKLTTDSINQEEGLPDNWF